MFIENYPFEVCDSCRSRTSTLLNVFYRHDIPSGCIKTFSYLSLHCISVHNIFNVRVVYGILSRLDVLKK